MLRNLLKSLTKPEAYQETVTNVELVQTHVSWIFLTDSHAYKIKKPVDFGFLNFSTIDRRRFYCNEEVRLNRRLCPDVYEGVVEVREAPGGAAFHGTGQVIDYAVRMKRLPEERMLERLVERGEVTPAAIRDVARVIADFHRTAVTSHSIAEYGRLERIMFNWEENLSQCVPFAGMTLPAKEREAIRQWVSSFAENHGDLFEKRVNQGFIRECDGDIHLENICLTDTGVCIFDCIEFNERFRCCDTAADVAFLLMDLDYHCRRDLAEAALNEYLAVSGDAGLMELIDFYKIYRAFVRGKVESFRLNDDGIGQEERELAGIRAARYFRLARGYIERRRLKKTLFITCGLIGSGKSTLAAQLAFELGIASFSSDIVRKRLAGIPPETRVRVPHGSGIYSPASGEATYAELLRLAKAELETGRSVIIDAAFIRGDQRRPFTSLARKAAADCVILHVGCPEAEQRDRLARRESDESSVSDGRLELLEYQKADLEPPDESEGVVITVTTTGLPDTLTSPIYGRLEQL